MSRTTSTERTRVRKRLLHFTGNVARGLCKDTKLDAIIRYGPGGSGDVHGAGLRISGDGLVRDAVFLTSGQIARNPLSNKSSFGQCKSVADANTFGFIVQVFEATGFEPLFVSTECLGAKRDEETFLQFQYLIGGSSPVPDTFESVISSGRSSVWWVYTERDGTRQNLYEIQFGSFGIDEPELLFHHDLIPLPYTPFMSSYPIMTMVKAVVMGVVSVVKYILGT